MGKKKKPRDGPQAKPALKKKEKKLAAELKRERKRLLTKLAKSAAAVFPPSPQQGMDLNGVGNGAANPLNDLPPA